LNALGIRFLNFLEVYTINYIDINIVFAMITGGAEKGEPAGAAFEAGNELSTTWLTREKRCRKCAQDLGPIGEVERALRVYQGASDRDRRRVQGSTPAPKWRDQQLEKFETNGDEGSGSRWAFSKASP
jgi:hypothetical protein